MNHKVTSINKITFRDDGSPYSEQFNDIYFDTESGYQQSEHVFIKGNNIAENLINCPQEYTIAETGFGTGLNFLLTLNLYKALAKEHKLPSLHFISTEKYPLNKEQLIKSLSSLNTLDDEKAALIACYPDSLEQQIECQFFNQKVKLTILLDDSTRALKAIKLPRKKNGLVDAWYLDGFSPARNPEMWQDALFEEMARLSKPQATISTFTIAGFIRRGLEKVGFRLKKRTYLGNKNEILTGKYQQNKLIGKGYQLRPSITKPQHVSIIGGGIASACAAYVLTKHGIKVTLYCKDIKVAQGASSNAIGALFPLIHQKQDDISLFYQEAFWFARNFYNDLNEQGYQFSHDWCGLLEISYKVSLEKRQQEFEKHQAWSNKLIQSIDKLKASEHANIPLEYGGLYFPKSGWIAPQELVEQLFKAASETKRLRIETSTTVESISQQENENWRLKTNKGNFNASVLVFCGGAESIKLPTINQLPLTSVRGQITSMNTNTDIGKLNTVICHKGYLTPQHKGIHCIGATFDKNTFDILPRDKDDQYNLSMLEKCLPNVTNKIAAWQQSDILTRKARLRCMTPDHLPMVGPMPNISAHISTYAHLGKDKNWRFYEAAPHIKNLYVLTGLGARGLCTAPLLAEILSADLTGSPYPIDNNMLFNLSPNRFVIRDLIKRKI
jgi:tRNA 5-methylaminomethyl-2-thiouridine biosynthesis bifunctional protein